MTMSMGAIIQQIIPQISPSMEALLWQTAQPMTATLDSLINQLIPLKPASAANPLPIAKNGVIEALTLSSTPLIKPNQGQPGEQQFKIDIQSGKQTFELVTKIPVPVGSRIQLSVSPNNLATILNIIEPGATGKPQGHHQTTVQSPINQVQTPLQTPVTPQNTTLAPEKLHRSTIEQGLRQTLPQQQPLKALLPLLQQIAQHPPKHWPKPLTQNIQVLLHQFQPADKLQHPPLLKRAINNSGTFFEAKLSQLAQQKNSHQIADKAPSPAAPANKEAITHDVKGLIQRIINQADKASASANLPTTNKTTTVTPSPASPRDPTYNFTTSPLQPGLTLNKATTGPQATPDKNVDVLLRQLGSQLLASLARSQMNQLETLASRQQYSPDNQGPANSWTLELPIVQGNNVDNLELRIDQQLIEDEKQKDKNAGKKLWTVMLAFDMHALGKMNVQLKILDQSVSATVWSQLETTHREVKQQVTALKSSLEKVGVKVKQLECQLGLPPKNNAPLYKQLVDVRT